MNIFKIVEQSKDKDNKAFQILFEMFYPDVYKTAFIITHSNSLAEDAAQEAFIKAFEKLHTLKEADKFGSWVKAIAARSAVDIIRSRKNLTLVEDLPESYNEEFIFDNWSLPEKKLLQGELKKQLLQAIYSLNAIHRQVIVMRYYLEFSISEIAKALALPVGTVKSRLHRGLKNLWVIINEQEDFSQKNSGKEVPCNEATNRTSN